MKKPYQKTMYACFIGYIVQAIVNNFVPLLFVTFQTDYRVPLQKITLLITVNFLIQLCVDLLSTGFIDRIGYRASVLLAHGFAAAGLILLTILPDRTADPFVGILLAVVVYALGGGLLEVLVSPILEACPTDNKASAMSLLHSFYCWGSVAAVGISTLFFALFSTDNWKIMSLIWAILPIVNAVMFTRVPIAPVVGEDEESMAAWCDKMLAAFKTKPAPRVEKPGSFDKGGKGGDEALRDFAKRLLK